MLNHSDAEPDGSLKFWIPAIKSNDHAGRHRVGTLGLLSRIPWHYAVVANATLLAGRWSVYLRDERALMVAQESFNLGKGPDKCCCQLWKWQMSDDNEKPNLMPQDSGQLVWLVPDPLIMRNRYPPPSPNFFQPFLIWTVLSEVIRVSFNG